MKFQERMNKAPRLLYNCVPKGILIWAISCIEVIALTYTMTRSWL